MTHLCIMMGNYFSGACGCKTAVLEWGRRKEFTRIEQVCTGRVSGVQPFWLLEVAYYTGADDRVLTACINLDYQHIIIDFGEIGEENRTEFSRCDKKFLVASLSEWQTEAFWAFVRGEWTVGRRSWIYLAVFGSEETRREMIKRLNMTIERIPLSVDAFTVDREMMGWFESIFTSHA